MILNSPGNQCVRAPCISLQWVTKYRDSSRASLEESTVAFHLLYINIIFSNKMQTQTFYRSLHMPNSNDSFLILLP